MRFPRSQTFLDGVTVIIFGVAVLAPLVGMCAHLGQLREQDEKRHLAPAPEFRLAGAWSAFPSAFTAYFDDHFGFRRTLVEAHAWTMAAVWGESASSNVVIGKQGWLFYAEGLRSYQGLAPFTPIELGEWMSELCNMRDWLASRGIKFYVLFPPDKHTIYPEYLPSSIKRGPSPTRLDVLTAALRRRQVDVVDIRQHLLQAKGSEILFHRTDSHWNGYAGFIAYQALLAEMSRSFPQLRSLPRSHFTLSPVSHTGDLAAVLGLTYGYDENMLFLRPSSNTLQLITSPSNKVVITERNDPQLPRMVMLRDSFANFVVDLLSENFRRAVYVWDYRFDPALITQERPDLVVFEMVERGLETASNNSLVLKDLGMAGDASAQANRP